MNYFKKLIILFCIIKSNIFITASTFLLTKDFYSFNVTVYTTSPPDGSQIKAK